MTNYQLRNLINQLLNWSLVSGYWPIVDSGRLSAEENMAIDQKALDQMNQSDDRTPQFRVFQWKENVITYGYLMKEDKIKEWAIQYGNVDTVKRPTGGGAVLHTREDVSFSLLWPRGKGFLPEKPRDSYEMIHSSLKEFLETSGFNQRMTLYQKKIGSCAEESPPTSRSSSVCFDEPVCNDIMVEGHKIVGGALRLTKKAILYQGTIQLSHVNASSLLPSSFSTAV